MKRKRRNLRPRRKPNTLPDPPIEEVRETEIESDSDDMLSEFSDDYNDFYVDEVSEKENRLEEEKTDEDDGEAAESSARPPRKKPISPLRRKVRRILSYVAIITVVIVVGVVLSLTVLFKTQDFDVIGNSQYNESDIIEVCGISKGTNIFLAGKKQAAERIKNSFPYFEDVKVSFRIPDTIKIEVTEAVPSYLIKQSDSSYLLISSKGRILKEVAGRNEYDLPIFIGPKLTSGEIGEYVDYEDDTVVSIIENISEVVADNGYQGITEIDATDTANVTFTYDGRIKVELGIPEAISYKVRTAMTIITTKIDVNPGSQIRGTLDVSRCNVTKRSYFDEDRSIDVNATEDPNAPTTAPDDSTWDDGGWDDGYDWSQDDGYDDWDDGYDDWDDGYDDGGWDDGGWDDGGYDYGGDIPGNGEADPW